MSRSSGLGATLGQVSPSSYWSTGKGFHLILSDLVHIYNAGLKKVTYFQFFLHGEIIDMYCHQAIDRMWGNGFKLKRVDLD